MSIRLKPLWLTLVHNLWHLVFGFTFQSGLEGSCEQAPIDAENILSNQTKSASNANPIYQHFKPYC